MLMRLSPMRAATRPNGTNTITAAAAASASAALSAAAAATAVAAASCDEALVNSCSTECGLPPPPIDALAAYQTAIR
jgi:hypothetical protein